MKKLILTVGLPRSGKSSWALNQKVPVVNRDAIRKSLYGKAYIQEAEEMVGAIEMYMVKSLFLAGHDTVIVDATHLKKSYRDKWECSEYSELQWEVDYEFFKTDKDICIKRAIKDGRSELVPIIEAMSKEAYQNAR